MKIYIAIEEELPDHDLEQIAEAICDVHPEAHTYLDHPLLITVEIPGDFTEDTIEEFMAQIAQCTNDLHLDSFFPETWEYEQC